MATRNKYIEDGIITKEQAAQWCDLTTRKICDTNGWTYTDGCNDNGVDAVMSDGKRVQIKCYFENSPTITLDFDFNKKQGTHANAHYIFEQAVKRYCKKFDFLAVYTGKLRGEPFDINKLNIIDSKQAIDYIIAHGHRSYMKYADSKKSTAQIALRKTACGDVAVSRK